MQLDIFADSRGTVLRNGVIDAFLQGDFQLARAAMATLAAEYPEDCLSPPAAVLLEVEKLPRETIERQSLVLLIDRCEQEIAVAAATVLGQHATAWMRKRVWAQLANVSAELSFDPDCPDAFAAPLWLRAAEWTRADSCIVRIASWRRIPVPLRWKIIAAVRGGNLDTAWPWIFELAWMAPGMLAELVDSLKDPVLGQMMTELDQVLDDTTGTWAWFPALALVVEPSLVARVASAQPAKESNATHAYACVQSLLTLERQGRHSEVADVRKRLRGLNDKLYRRYMKTR